MSQSLSFVGAGMRVFINGTIFGICTGISWESNLGRRPIYGLDNILPQELAPGMTSVSGVIQCIKIKLDGGLEGRGISPRFEDVLSEKYIQITVIDRLTDTIIFNVNKAAVEGQQWRASVGSLVRGSFSFTGVSWNQYLSI